MKHSEAENGLNLLDMAFLRRFADTPRNRSEEQANRDTGSGFNVFFRNFECFFSPTCQVRVVRFLSELFSSSSASSSISSSSSSSQSRSQWAQPGLHRELQIPVGTSQWALPDLHRELQISGHCRTSTATSRSQWALPGLNRYFQIAVGTAGPQP